MFDQKCVYTYTGDLNATLNTLTNQINNSPLQFSDLSLVNYPNGVVNNSSPNLDNTGIFMNQPMSWWLETLNAGTVKYCPVSNYVNWAYTPSANSDIHIDISISDLLIPNSTESVSTDNNTNVMTSVLKPKNGMCCTSTWSMNSPGVN